MRSRLAANTERRAAGSCPIALAGLSCVAVVLAVSMRRAALARCDYLGAHCASLEEGTAPPPACCYCHCSSEVAEEAKCWYRVRLSDCCGSAAEEEEVRPADKEGRSESSQQYASSAPHSLVAAAAGRADPAQNRRSRPVVGLSGQVCLVEVEAAVVAAPPANSAAVAAS